jgi:HEAT repeat protein
MNRRILLGVVAASAVALAPLTAFADHCSNYRGPGGEVPPAGRTPNDPTPPPTPGGGTTPGGGLTGGVTPGQPVPGLSGPAGLPTGARASAAGGATAGRTGGATPAGRRKASASEGFERWEFWWEHNKDAYLNLKTNLADLVFTSSADYFLGKSETRGFGDVVEPSRQMIDTELVPALEKVADDEFYLVRDAAVLALAKVGGEGARAQIEKKLSDDNRYVQESAVIALGILGDTAAVPTLLAILGESVQGMKLLGTTEIRPELRAFAAVALGLLGDEAATATLCKVTLADEARKDAPVAATLALGLLGSEAAIDHLISLAQNPAAEELVRAHAVTSLGKLGDKRALTAIHRALRDKSLHVSRSAVIAMGLLGDQNDEEVVKTLVQIAQKGDDIQARNWACISLGQIGGEAARKSLLTVLRGERRSLQAFAGLGIGIMLKNNPDSATIGYLREAMALAKEQSVRGAFAISLGIAQDKASESTLVSILDSDASPELRGHAAVALGLMKARGASTVVQKVLKENAKKPELARSAAIALGLMGDRDAIPILTQVLVEAQVDEVRSSAALALGQIGDITAIEPLVAQIFQRPNAPERTRAFATTALGIIGENELLPVMSRLSRDSNYRALVPSIRTLMSLL